MITPLTANETFHGSLTNNTEKVRGTFFFENITFYHYFCFVQPVYTCVVARNVPCKLRCKK